MEKETPSRRYVEKMTGYAGKLIFHCLGSNDWHDRDQDGRRCWFEKQDRDKKNCPSRQRYMRTVRTVM